MIRDDLSSKLIHLTKRGDGINPSDVFDSIISEGALRGGTGLIKGGYRCICFSEAPIGKLGQILANPSQHGVRYAPLGVMVDKAWLYAQGGRPVIYQSEEEYELLVEEQRYRHVRFEPQNDIDFTWEREWRIKTDYLTLKDANPTFIVPSQDWVDAFKRDHLYEIETAIRMVGEDAHFYIKPFPYNFIVLEDLGFST